MMVAVARWTGNALIALGTGGEMPNDGKGEWAEWRRKWIKIFVNSRDQFYRDMAIEMMESDCIGYIVEEDGRDG